MPIERTSNGTRGTAMVGTTLLRKVFEPLANRQIGAYRRTGGTDRTSRMMKFPIIL